MSDSQTPGRISAASASLWSTLDLFGRQGIQFIVSIILARLLLPEEFGVVAIVSFFIAVAATLAQAGFAVALIQNQQTTHDEENAVFWASLLLCTLLAAALAAGAEPLARFYDEPELRWLLLAGAVIIFISGFGAVPNALLTRELAFDRLLKLGLTATSVAAVCAVALAFSGFGPWALVASAFTTTLISAIGIWFIHPWRPSLQINLASGRKLFGFGAWIGLSSLLDTAYTQGFSLLIGKLHGLAAVGLYNRGANTQQLPTGLLSAVIARVALPIFSAHKGDVAAIGRGVKLSVGLTMFINLPMMIGLAVTAPMVIEVLFGPIWLPAAPVLSILALAGVLYPIHVITIQAILALGQSALFFRLEIMKKLVAIACVVVGSFFGIVGLAWSQLAASILALLFTAYPAGRLIGFGWVAGTSELKNLGLPVLALVAVVYGTMWALSDVNVFLRTGLVIGAGAMSFLAIAALTKNPQLAEAARLLRELRSSRNVAA